MLRNAFLVPFVTAAVPLALAGGWFASRAAGSRQVLLQLHGEAVSLAATKAGRHLDLLEGRLESIQRLCVGLSRGAASRGSEEGLKRSLALEPDILGLAVVDRNGREVRRWTNSPLLRGSWDPCGAARPALERAASLRRPASVLSSIADAPALVAVRPLSADRYACVAVSLEGLWNELYRHRLGATGLAVLATADGRLLAGPGTVLPHVDPAFLKRLFQGGDRGWSDTIASPEGPYVGMFERVAGGGPSDWYALTLEPKAEALPYGRRLALILGGLAVLAGALAFAGAALLEAPLSAGLLDARRVAEELALARRREAGLEARLAQERARAELIVEQLDDGIVLIDLSGEVVYINAPAVRALGLEPGDKDGLRAAVQQLIERRARSEIVEVPVEGPRGRELRFYRTSVTVLPADAKERGVLILMRDVTTERELTRMKEEFFHSVAHDLRAPVFAIQGYLRLLHKSLDLEPRLKAHFDAIHQACDKLTLLIQDLLDSARLESGQLKLGVSAVAPGDLLRRMQRVFGALAAEKGIGLDVKLDGDLPPDIDADDRLMERVFTNLVSNALKAVPHGGRITLAAAPAGERELEFSVADTGPGVPEDKRGIIFEKFTQLAPGKQGGFGLGLSICRKIVELHGGKIWLESKEGQGSQFIFRMPIRQMV